MQFHIFTRSRRNEKDMKNVQGTKRRVLFLAALIEKALNVTLEDEEIKELIAGKDYTTQVTLTGNATIENIIEDQTKRGIVAEGDVNLIVVVTLTFEDGSGYNIPVDWQNWTVGEPEFAQQVSPPEDQFRIIGLPSTERTTSVP